MTVPGLISLGGVLLAIAMLLLDRTISQHGGLPYPELTAIPIGNARPILTTVAASSMAALSLVYSSVLVVFTLAAGNIGPRLLLRFARDRTNQIAVGTLGGTFLYSLIILRNQYDDIPVDISVNVALLLAALCVIMLLFFVNTAAKRVTIDEEVANIGNALDDELAKAIAANTPLDRENIVRPLGKEFTVASKGDGYINRIAFAEIARLASKNDAYVDFDVIPGNYVIKGQKLQNRRPWQRTCSATCLWDGRGHLTPISPFPSTCWWRSLCGHCRPAPTIRSRRSPVSTGYLPRWPMYGGPASLQPSITARTARRG